MGAESETKSLAQKLRPFRGLFILAGWLFAFLALIAGIVSLFTEPGLFLNIILFLQFVLDIGIFLFAYGLAVIQGRRWHIFGLLIVVFFGSFMIGLFSMVGRETTIGYYIWAVGGLLSLSLILILVIYWEKLLDG